ncbi:trypsin-like peptidase domain-containing protein [Streptomyces polyrhachis]|uniref:Trypsin-like peptidase domain-containing protein n=1 Tax=Streptomyces polyrhachis TaxID=1282885 RepID=A0ABW2GH73_9ACTN
MSAERSSALIGADPRRIAEIIVSTPCGARRGSGYRVTDTVVLTAAHVVADATDVVVRCDADRPQEWSAPANVAWRGTDTDLVALACTPPPGAPPAPAARFGTVADDRYGILAACALGFPLWKLRHGAAGSYRELVQADGTIALLSNRRDGTLELLVTAPDRDTDPARSPWSGMSGAAVWVGEHIIGVVAEHHRAEGLNRLTAVRLDHALRGLPPTDRTALARLLDLTDPIALPPAGNRLASPPPAAIRVVGVPVAYGIELFKNRVRELGEVIQHLYAPAIRLVTVTGRRGIGKSALAAKVMDTLDRGPGSVALEPRPRPDGLVNLSTRTRGISLESFYFGCAELLGPQRERALRKTWEEDTTVHGRLAALDHALNGHRVVVLLDNLEELLHDDGRVRDEELAALLEWAFRAPHAPRLLATSTVPPRLAPELRRFTARIDLAVGLGATESAALLRELDRDGSAGIADLSDRELLQAGVQLHGVPRALELLVGAAADAPVPFPRLRDVLADFSRREDIVHALAGDRLRQLEGPARTVVSILAALRVPATPADIEEVAARIDPGLPVPATVAALRRTHLIHADRVSGTVALHPLDADLAYGQLPLAGATGRQAVERAIAAWYGTRTTPEESWRRLEDLAPYRSRFEHLMRAEDYDEAARVLAEISEWLVWHGSVLAAVAMHQALDGRLTEAATHLTHTLGYGHALLSAGPMQAAVARFTEAVSTAERLDDRAALQSALFGLGDAHRQLGELRTTVEVLERAAELAHELGDAEREEHALLSRSLTLSYLGDGEAALTGADRLAALAATSDELLTTARAANARTIALLTLGRWTQTIESGVEAVRAYRAADSKEAIAYALNAQGVAWLALEQPLRAAVMLGEGRQEASVMENPRAEGVCLFNLAWAHWRCGHPTDTAEAAARAVAALDRAGAAEAVAARALTEAARMLPADPRAAATALHDAATALPPNAEIIRSAWLREEAERLLAESPEPTTR